MHNNWFNKLTNLSRKIYKNVDHMTVNFVDDSTNVIAFNDHTQIQSYLSNYYTLIHNYYNINKLKINADKTQLLMVYKAKHIENFKNFYFYANNFKIKPKKVIKILGFLFKRGLKIGYSNW